MVVQADYLARLARLLIRSRTGNVGGFPWEKMVSPVRPVSGICRVCASNDAFGDAII